MPDSNDDRSTTHEPHLNVSGKKQPLRVNLPEELPELTPEVSRILLDILLELAARKRNNLATEHHTEPRDQ